MPPQAAVTDSSPLRSEGARVPRWISALNAVIIVILTFKIWACLSRPELLFGEGAWAAGPSAAMRELAGRNLAMVGISAAAFIQPRRWLPAVLLLGFVRETVDMVLVPVQLGLSAASLGQAASFLPFLVAYGLAWRVVARR